MNNFMFNVKQLKMNKFINYIWQLIISTPNATLEVPSLRPCFPPMETYFPPAETHNFARKTIFPSTGNIFLACENVNCCSDY